ncbi:MAG TPA: iron ABC transporter permease, partial [Alphaproteobacteria bacterium]|nr:iron ABC transporter permease [Alphaproteobacteria bacterium]
MAEPPRRVLDAPLSLATARNVPWTKPRRVPGNGAIVAAAAAVALLSLVPLGFVIGVAVESGWDKVVELVVRPRVGELLVNTVLLEAVTLPLTVVLAVGMAWLTERTDLPGARWWSAIAVAPLAIPAFIQSYAWNSFAPWLHGFWGAVLISVLAYLPFVYLPVAAQLRRLDPALEDVAASLGQTPARIFFRVVVPQLRLPVCAGALLVGLHLLGEYGLYVLMRFNTFATAIVDQFQTVYNGPAANLLGGVLILCCLVLLALEAWARGDRRYARVGSGAARDAMRRPLGRWRVPALGFLTLMAALSIGVTLITLGRWLVIGGGEIWRLDEIGAAFAQTAFLAVVGAALTTLI